MKTSLSRFLTRSVFTLLLTAAAAIPASAETNRIRVGVYDSRAVAVAYANSKHFDDPTRAARTDYDKAKAANDEKRMNEIKAAMEQKQRRAHEQGFSTGSVISIMDRIKPSLQQVARQTKVDQIVSKWELNYHSSNVEMVDITDLLIDLFEPTEKGRRWAKEVQAHKPVPVDELADHKH